MCHRILYIHCFLKYCSNCVQRKYTLAIVSIKKFSIILSEFLIYLNRINKIFPSLFLDSIIQVIPKNFVSGWKEEQEEFFMSFHYPKSGISSISPYCICCTLIYIIVYLFVFMSLS